MFTASLFIIAQIWKQPKCPLMNEWIKKMWYIHIYNEISFSHEKKEILSLATIWMDPKDIMLSEISQIKINIVYLTHHMWNLHTHKKSKQNSSS